MPLFPHQRRRPVALAGDVAAAPTIRTCGVSAGVAWREPMNRSATATGWPRLRIVAITARVMIALPTTPRRKLHPARRQPRAGGGMSGASSSSTSASEGNGWGGGSVMSPRCPNPAYPRTVRRYRPQRATFGGC